MSKMFTLDTVVCQVRMKDGSLRPLLAEEISGEWLEKLMFAQPDNFEKIIDFVKSIKFKLCPYWEERKKMSFDELEELIGNKELSEYTIRERWLVLLGRLYAIKLAC